MAKKIKPLPIVERWDCHTCSICCRGAVIALSDDDLAKLREQKWEQHPDYRGVRTVVSRGWFNKQHQLAQRADGSCVFLDEDGLCRVHKEHGLSAKPLACQVFPLQLVPLGKNVRLTLRRACPSAVAGKGRKAQEHIRTVAKLMRKSPVLNEAIRAPAVTPGRSRNWDDALRVMEAIEQIVADKQAPLVRRLVHALLFCNLLAKSGARKLDGRQLAELVKLLAPLSGEGVGDYFVEREPPRGASGVMFRLAAAEYARLHPDFRGRPSWRDWFRSTMAAVRLVRGRGQVPPIHPAFPPATFDELERPLGHLPPETTQPLADYFEAAAVSKNYAVLGRSGWSVTESFQALALSHSIALWVLRWDTNGREPTPDDVVKVVVALDRGQGYEPLLGRRHQQRVGALAKLDELEKLTAWYAR